MNALTQFFMRHPDARSQIYMGEDGFLRIMLTMQRDGRTFRVAVEIPFGGAWTEDDEWLLAERLAAAGRQIPPPELKEGQLP